MTYKCNVLFVPKHRAPVVRGNHVGSPPFFAACARIQSYAAVRICTRGGKRKPYPGPDTEAASAFLLYYV